jgi:hypothetical protein
MREMLASFEIYRLPILLPMQISVPRKKQGGEGKAAEAHLCL